MITIGWREWVAIPAWNINFLKVKVDTGARTSSIHAEQVKVYSKEGSDWVRFTVYPWQKSRNDSITVETPVLAFRDVRSSSGESESRPVISIPLRIAGVLQEAEITLTDRDVMGFRMLLGREAIRGGFLINPGVSYLGGRPSKSIRDINRGKI